MSRQPKLHNAMWPGLVGKGTDEGQEPPISLETIAQLAGMTPPAFSRFYKQKTGTTFQQTLIETRLLDACQELITTNRSISEICFACGFNNLSNFNRQFKRNKGLSPKAFRNQWKTSQLP